MLQMWKKKSRQIKLFQQCQKTIEKNICFYDVIAIVTTRQIEKKFQRHIFVTIQIQTTRKFVNIKTMIDCDAIWNFLFQLKIKKLILLFFFEINVRLCTVDEIHLKIYKNHVLTINLQNVENKTRAKTQKFVNANIVKIKIILNLFWLKIHNSNINWITKKFLWQNVFLFVNWKTFNIFVRVGTS